MSWFIWPLQWEAAVSSLQTPPETPDKSSLCTSSCSNEHLNASMSSPIPSSLIGPRVKTRCWSFFQIFAEIYLKQIDVRVCNQPIWWHHGGATLTLLAWMKSSSILELFAAITDSIFFRAPAILELMVKTIQVRRDIIGRIRGENSESWKKSVIIQEQERASQIHHQPKQFNFYIPRNIPAANPSEVSSTKEEKRFEWCSSSLSQLKPRPAEMLTHRSAAI